MFIIHIFTWLLLTWAIMRYSWSVLLPWWQYSMHTVPGGWQLLLLLWCYCVIQYVFSALTHARSHVLLPCSYRGDGVEGILDRKEQDFVATVGVVWVGGASDPLAGGVVKEGLLACDVDGLATPTRHTLISTLHHLKLHQRLPLKGHHHHIAAINTEQQGSPLEFNSLSRKMVYYSKWTVAQIKPHSLSTVGNDIWC